jgi:hypothetical protein
MIKQAQTRAWFLKQSQTAPTASKVNTEGEKKHYVMSFLPGYSQQTKRVLTEQGIKCFYRNPPNVKRLLQTRQPSPSNTTNNNKNKTKKAGPTTTPMAAAITHRYNTRLKSKLPAIPETDEQDDVESNEPKTAEVDKLAPLCPRTKNIVYGVKCLECEEVYVGESSRQLRTRVAEHMASTRKGDQSNSIANHHIQTQHQINWESSDVLLKTKLNNKPVLRALESVAIRLHEQAGKTLMNMQPESYPRILEYLPTKLQSKLTKNILSKSKSKENPTPNSQAKPNGNPNNIEISGHSAANFATRRSASRSQLPFSKKPKRASENEHS